MFHGQFAYIHKIDVAPQKSEQKSQPNELMIDGNTYCYIGEELPAIIEKASESEDELSAKDFVRVLCIKRKVKKKQVTKFVVDASHLELSPVSPVDDKFEIRDWSDFPEAEPLPANMFIGNKLDLEIAEAKLTEKYNIVFPQNVLAIMLSTTGPAD